MRVYHSSVTTPNRASCAFLTLFVYRNGAMYREKQEWTQQQARGERSWELYTRTGQRIFAKYHNTALILHSWGNTTRYSGANMKKKKSTKGAAPKRHTRARPATASLEDSFSQNKLILGNTFRERVLVFDLTQYLSAKALFVLPTPYQTLPNKLIHTFNLYLSRKFPSSPLCLSLSVALAQSEIWMFFARE